MAIKFKPNCYHGAKKNDIADFRKFAQHFAAEIGDDIINYVDNDVLLYSRYIFTKRLKGRQYGYCTHCRKEFDTIKAFISSLKHGQSAKCPMCKSVCTVRASGISRKYLCDSAYVVYYEKSKVNQNAIVARGFRVTRDYRGKYTDMDTKFTTLAMYVFEPGRPQMWEIYWDGFYPRQTVISFYSTSQYADNNCSLESIEKAIHGTPFQYSTWDQHDQPQGDYVKFFELFSKYPCVEYLTKMGFKYFVSAKLFDRKTYGAINWNAASIEKVLKMNKQDIREVREYKGDISPLIFWIYQRSRKDPNRPSIDELSDSFEDMDDCSNELKAVMKYAASIKQIAAYIRKQMYRRSEETRKAKDIMIAWKDYLFECKELEFDLNNERTIFPSDLFAAHQKTSLQVSAKNNQALDEKIKGRLKNLNKRFCFKEGDFFIRPAFSAGELIAEGKHLNICVGTYAERYAKGETIILLVRKVNDPFIPFFTIEIKNNGIRQSQGLNHRSPTKEVAEFLEKFKQVKLKTKQEVAV